MDFYKQQEKFIKETPEARSIVMCRCGEMYYEGGACKGLLHGKQNKQERRKAKNAAIKASRKVLFEKGV
jgi:hypothetical protein